MSHAVVDASAFVCALTDATATDLRGSLSSITMHAPHLVDVEVLSALRRLDMGVLTSGEAADTVAAFQQLSVTRHAHGAFLGRIWELRNNFSAYDAAYVALAEALEVPLITRDLRLARSACALVRTVTP